MYGNNNKFIKILVNWKNINNTTQDLSKKHVLNPKGRRKNATEAATEIRFHRMQLPFN